MTSSVMCCVLFFCKQKTSYESRISDWSSDVCSSDLMAAKKQKDSSADLRTNEKKWTKPLMDAGWTALPCVIIENQRQLMLSPLDLNIIVYLASKWWTAEGKPFPSKTTMAK